jgi:surface carbohydrate biosynthesis protein
MINRLFQIFALMKKNFVFKNLESNNLVIFDCINENYMKDLFDNTKYFSLSTRLDRIEKIYLNMDTLKFVVKNFFKRKLKINYLISIINQIDPKMIITLIDNSIEFSIISKHFKDKIPFYAIQGANRGDVKFMNEDEVKIFEFDTFFCFGNYEKKLYLKKNIKINKFIFSGPLRPSLALRHIKKEKIKLNENKYDIFLPTELSTGSPYNPHTNYSESCVRLADYTVNVCKRNRLNLIFSAEAYSNSKTLKDEHQFYKKIIDKYGVKLTPKTSKYSSYINVLQSNLIIGLNTTLLREAFYLNRKVLACNLTNHIHADFPVKSIASPDIKNFNDFEKQVLKLLDIKKETYFEILKDDINNVVQSDNDCYTIINDEVRRITNTS